MDTIHPFDLNNDPSHDMDDEVNVSVPEENTMNANPEVPTYFVGTFYQIPEGRAADTLTPGEVMAMTFPSFEEAFKFYLEYGYCKGFGVRKCEKKANRDGVVNYRTCVCSCEGFRPNKHLERLDNVRPQRPQTRCGCRAIIKFRMSLPSRTWSVQGFDDDHNHNLIRRTLVNQHRCFRQLSSWDIMQNEFLKKYRFKTSDVVGVLAEQNGGYHENRFLHKDVYNHDAAQRRLNARHGDVMRALAYLDAKKQVNPTCYHTSTKDAEGRLENLFWSDASACLDYQYFGDVVSFDATYKTNMYEKPFVVFVGINNHGQTIFFGGAFMANESEESYIWLLHEFTKCHGGKHPMGVITDSDKAMRAAVRNVWPNSNHRLCEWHLEKNCLKLKSDTLNEAYMKLMRKRCTPEVFEAGWRTLMDDYKDASNTGWAIEAYQKRHMWARALLRGQFYAGMTTTQRSESMNSFIKLFTTSNMTIRDMIETFDFKLGSWRQKELTSEYKTRHTTPIVRTCLYALEKHAMTVYTNYSYMQFVNEALKFDQDNVIVPGELVRAGTSVMYQVKALSTGRVSTVAVDDTGDLISCSCKRFEETGMPCSHIITVTKGMGRDSIPPRCIMTRWTQNAMDNHERLVPNPVNTDREANKRFAALTTIMHGVCQTASKNPSSFAYIREGLTRLHSEMVGTQQNGDSDPSGVGQNRNVPTSEQRAEIVLDPVTARGRRNENGGKKKKHCTRCKQPGHNVTTCRFRRPGDNGTGDHSNGNVRHAWDDQPPSYNYSQPDSSSQMHYSSQQPGSSSRMHYSSQQPGSFSRPHDSRTPHGWQPAQPEQVMWWQVP